ncbi:MAG: hypothetical protein II710_06815 [Clostridia bacterium]|nr:hypothetical protein [Clostridia bacterium]
MPYQGYYARKKQEKEKEQEKRKPDEEIFPTEDKPIGEPKAQPDERPEEPEKDVLRSTSDDQKIHEEEASSPARQFVSAHIRLITFLVCLTMFLALAGPFSVIQIIRYTEERKEVAKPQVTMQVLEGLYKRSEKITWNDFKPYQSETVKQSTQYLAKNYWIPGDVYFVRVGGLISEIFPEYVIVVNADTGNSCDLLDAEDDFFAFLEEENNQKES